LEVTNPVAVAIGERLDVELIDDRVLEPERLRRGKVSGSGELT